jgi:ribosome-associated protein
MSAEPQRHRPPSLDGKALAVEAARALHDQRTEEIVVLDLRGLSPVTDFFVIGSGTSERQMRAAFDAVEEAGRQAGWKRFGAAGDDSSTWMLVDFVDVVVHLFAPEYRQYYDLELLWGDAPRVAWNRDAGPPPGDG